MPNAPRYIVSKSTTTSFLVLSILESEETNKFHRDDHTESKKEKVMRKRKKMKGNEEKNRERIEKLSEEKIELLFSQ